MAGRIVVLEFKNRHHAEAFLANREALKHDGAVPLAEFIRPTQFCQCADKKRQNVANWVKGKRTGLYLCVACRKPSVHHQTGILTRLQYVFGFNQLEADD